jgi:acetolactate synthase-1/3 small subunit
MDQIKRQTIVVLVDNEAGVLSQVTRLFSRKGYNIETLAVGATERPDLSRITIEIMTDDDHIALLANQLRKLIPVHSVKLLTPQKSIRRELIIIKMRTPTADLRNEIIQIANIYRGSIIDVSNETLTVAVIGNEGKIGALEEFLSSFEIIELARTGTLAMERGKYSISDASKEHGEFEYGKTML